MGVTDARDTRRREWESDKGGDEEEGEKARNHVDSGLKKAHNLSKVQVSVVMSTAGLKKLTICRTFRFQ
jgi:hypothetical protein